MNKIKDLFNQYLDTKIKKIVASIACLLIIGCAGGILYFKIKTPTHLNLLYDRILIEYGDVYEPSFDNLIDTEGLSKDDIKEMKKNVKIKHDIENETKTNEDGSTIDLEYGKVGKYKIKVTYDNDTTTIPVQIADTTAPTIALKDNKEYIQMNIGTDLNTFDFNSALEINDLSEIKKTDIDFSAVDVNTVGNYPIVVTSEDIYDNEISTNVYVIVADENTDITELVADVHEKVETEKKKVEEQKKNNQSNSNTTSKNDSNTNSSKNESSSNSNESNTGNNSNSSNTNNNSKPEHSHSWQAVTTIVHHDEIGHYETQIVQEAYDEPIYEKGYCICNKCGYYTKDADLMAIHVLESCGGGWKIGSVQVGTQHHDAVTKQVWIVDKAAWDETVITGYKCSCGATK